jgi:hypothetical protein
MVVNYIYYSQLLRSLQIFFPFFAPDGRSPGRSPPLLLFVFRLTVACLRRCPSPNKQTCDPGMQVCRAWAMWVRRALQRAEPGGPQESRTKIQKQEYRPIRGQAVRRWSFSSFLEYWSEPRMARTNSYFLYLIYITCNL